MKTPTHKTIDPVLHCLFSRTRAARIAIQNGNFDAASESISMLTNIARFSKDTVIKQKARETVSQLGFELAGAKLHPTVDKLFDIGSPHAEAPRMREAQL